MESIARKSSNKVIGNVPLGAHFCLFYKTREDLFDVLVPYIKDGLKNNEFCIWVTMEPLDVDEIKRRMSATMPDFCEYLSKEQIEILPYTEWYVIDGVFDSERVLNGWLKKLHHATARGFSGLRATGDMFWLEKSGWKAFLDYEQDVNQKIGLHNITGLCAYSLDQCSANDILDVVSTHQFALIKSEGQWQRIENAILKEKSEALREAEEKYRTIVENANEGILVIDQDFNVTFFNQKFAEMVGYTFEEIRGSTLAKFLDPGSNTQLYSNLEKLSTGISQVSDFKFRHKNGSIIWAISHASPLLDKNGNYAGATCLITDITERKQAEDALRENEERFKAIFDHAGMGIGIADSTGRIQDCNHAFEEMLGYSKNELLGKHIADITYSEDISKNLDLFKQSVENRIDNYQMDKRYIRKDGSLIWCTLHVSVIKDHNGNFKYSLATIKDITTRKKAEEDLDKAKAQAELYLDLMGHDINNMNQIGIGFLELALNTLNIYEDDRLLIEKPLAAFDNSSRLIANVRKLQKIKSGELFDKEMDVGQVISDVIYHYLSDHNNVIIKYNPIIDCKVMANELLYDLFSNLVGNAIKHSRGSPVININIDKIREDGKLYYYIGVEDNGPGVPDEMKTLIFNRTLQGSDKAKGSGIGLYLVNTLVENYHGRVWVEDRVRGDRSKGSRFVIMLPAVNK